MSFLHLPVELRLAIYSELFGEGVASVDGGRQDTGTESQTPSMLPTINGGLPNQQRSAQLLRTCKTILAEARPILYDHTVFRTTFNAFAGRLPICLANGNPSFPEVRHLEWQLNCDLLKRYDPAEVRVEPKDAQSLRSVQVVCQAENWRESPCSDWGDHQALVKGRQQVLDFVKLLHANMAVGSKQFTLVENVRSLARGRVMFNIVPGPRIPGINETIIE